MHMPLRSLLLAVALLLLLPLGSTHADDWPQWRGPTRDSVWHETGIVQKFAEPKLKIKWRADIGAGYSGPTIADGRVFVSDRKTDPEQVERVHCFDAGTGEKIWSQSYACPYKISYEAGPRAAISISDGRAYSLGAMGDLYCFDAKNGKILWKHQLADEYKVVMPIWGIAASPLVEGDVVIVQIGGDGACLIAFDKATGEQRWKSLGDRASYSAPIIVDQAGKRVVVCLTGDNLVGVSATTGEAYWKLPFQPSRMVISVATPVVHDSRILVASFYDGAMMAEMASDALTARQVWRKRGPSEEKTEAIQPIISTPYFDGDNIYGVDSYGQLRCLDAKTGDRVWESLDAVPKARWATIHFIKNGDRMFLFNERGELIIARLDPAGYHEISRAKLIEPTTAQLNQRGGVCWSHPGFAGKCVFARNDKEIVCADLAER